MTENLDAVCGECSHFFSYHESTNLGILKGTIHRCLAFVPSGPCDCPGWVEAKRNIFAESSAVPPEGRELAAGDTDD